MASPDPKLNGAGDWSGRVIAYRAFATNLAARREVLGEPKVLRNTGNRRTNSKKALLEALDELGATW